MACHVTGGIQDQSLCEITPSVFLLNPGCFLGDSLTWMIPKRINQSQALERTLRAFSMTKSSTNVYTVCLDMCFI